MTEKTCTRTLCFSQWWKFGFIFGPLTGRVGTKYKHRLIIWIEESSRYYMKSNLFSLCRDNTIFCVNYSKPIDYNTVSFNAFIGQKNELFTNLILLDYFNETLSGRSY